MLSGVRLIRSSQGRPIVFLALVLLLVSMAAFPLPTAAQSWPASWILIDTDPNEPGQANYRDVLSAYYNYDSAHLYLRLTTVSAPAFSGANGPARFKWFIDMGLDGNNLHFSGGNILGTDYLLFVEDSNNSGPGEIYLLPANGNDSFSQYEPWNNTNVLPISNTSIASYRISGNSIDMWIALNQLGGATSPANVSLAWATDQEDPGLESAPNLDSTDGTETPIHLDADLLVDKDVSNHTPFVGSNVVYTVTVSNTGPATATNVRITDLLPAGVAYQSYSATQGTYNSGTGLWTVGTLANGASAALSITVTVTSTGTIINTATITAVDQPDPDPGDNSDSVTMNSLANNADLAVLKDVSNHTPVVGNNVIYTVTVTNTGPATATNVQITDLLPAEVTYQSYSATQGTYNNGTGLWTVGSLANGSSATLSITVTVTSPGTIINTATITAVDQPDPDPGDNSDSATINPLANVDLIVLKDVSNHTPYVGNNVTYTVTVNNSGPVTATNVQITDLLPAGVTYQSYSATQGSYSNVTGIWTVGTLADGASASLSITVTVTSTGTIVNTATITAVDQPDPDPGDNSDSVTINALANNADLSVLKDVSNHTPYEGSTVNFTVILTNSGPATATAIQVTDQLPAGVTYQSYSASQGVYSNVTGVWTVGTLANGASATLTITATVNGGTAGSTINNTATITGVSPSDPHPGDNSDTVEFFPTAYEADLSVIKYVNNALPYEGSTIVFTVAVQNNGPVAATNIQITDQLPSAVTFQSYSATAGSYTDTTGIWAIPSLGVGSFATLAITVTVNTGTAGSTSFNTAAVTALDQPDQDPSDDSSTVGFTPRGAPAGGGGTRGVPVFPNMYMGIGMALGAAIVAYLVRRRLTNQEK